MESINKEIENRLRNLKELFEYLKSLGFFKEIRTYEEWKKMKYGKEPEKKPAKVEAEQKQIIETEEKNEEQKGKNKNAENAEIAEVLEEKDS